MRQPTLVGSSITTRGGDAKGHGRMLPVAPIEPAELLLGAGQADPETFDLAEPASGFGPAPAGQGSNGLMTCHLGSIVAPCSGFRDQVVHGHAVRGAIPMRVVRGDEEVRPSGSSAS